MSTLKEICKDQRELLNECRQNIKELTEENKKLKEQIDTSQVSRLIAGNYQIKAERDTLIDDIAVLKANISRLERENRDLKHENKALREQNYKYCKLSNHIRLKAEMNPSVDRYIELKNFITRLEKGE